MIPVNKKITVAGDEHVVYYAFTGRDEQNNLDNPTQISWNNTPNLRGDSWNPLNKDGEWDCDDWTNWYKQLLLHFDTKEQAITAFSNAWGQFYAYDNTYNTCQQNKVFVDYFLSQGYDVRSKIRRVLDSIEGGAANLADAANLGTKAVKDGVQGADNTVSSLGNVLKWLPWIALAIGLIIAAAFGYSYYKKNLKS